MDMRGVPDHKIAQHRLIWADPISLRPLSPHSEDWFSIELSSHRQMWTQGVQDLVSWTHS